MHTFKDMERLSVPTTSDEDEVETGEAAQERRSNRRPTRLAPVVAAGLGVVAVVAIGRHATQPSPAMISPAAGEGAPEVLGAAAAAQDDGPTWGCGLLGNLPGISQDGKAAAETQRLIDGIKSSSTYNKVTYWNWNLAPQTEEGTQQHLTPEFIFHPEMWGAGVVEDKYVREANKADFLDSNGQKCPATMGDLFLGSNEPDIFGSCMGNMFGSCTAPCDPAAVASGDCPAAHLDSDVPAHANAKGQCNCWQFSHATGVGFWPFNGCSAPQPLPGMWADPGCVDHVMDDWVKTSKIVAAKGYKYTTTPLIAANMSYAKSFIEKACATCQDISCGCPNYVAFHFYAYDCQPIRLKGYENFKDKIAAVADIMEKFPFVKGAIINEVGMLNCAGEIDDPICIPNNGKYPASKTPDHSCPSNSELPDGMATFMDKLFDIIIDAKTSDGRAVVKGFSWFNEDQAGGTYNLQLFDKSGHLNKLGEAYINGCSRWGKAQRGELEQ